jgi:predicted Zn-dependent protease
MTEPGASYLVDTNILLRLVQADSPEHENIRSCINFLWAQGADLFYTSQNLAVQDFRRYGDIVIVSPVDLLRTGVGG